MATNYEDKRLTEVKADEKAALNEVDVKYGDMISQSDKYYEDQIQASKDWADKQTELQNQKTDFAIEKIEQEKAQAQKDYTKEQSGAYVDWQKQSNQYGANAEKMAAGGLTNTGFSESSQVSMYNTYQNRVATARAVFEQAKQNFTNAINDAILQNSSILAEIAAQAYQKRLELSLQGFQYKNQLLTEQADRKLAVQQLYQGKWQSVLNQINTENALAEEVRQFNANLALEKEKFAWQKAQAAKSSIQKGGYLTGRTPVKDPVQAVNKDDTSRNYSSAIKAGNTSNANKKIKSLATMQGQTGSKTAIANSIVAYASTGKINTNEAAYMLNYFGYDIGKYLE